MWPKPAYKGQWKIKLQHQRICITIASSTLKAAYFSVSKTDLAIVRSDLSKRFTLAATVPGTCSVHYFEPTTPLTIGAKRTSADEQFSVSSCFGPISSSESPTLPSPNNYVACAYTDKWYVGLVTEIHSAEGDATIQFLHPHGPSPSFYWPHRDTCCVPFTHSIC